jgi:hypothetical protein
MSKLVMSESSKASGNSPSITSAPRCGKATFSSMSVKQKWLDFETQALITFSIQETTCRKDEVCVCLLICCLCTEGGGGGKSGGTLSSATYPGGHGSSSL